MRSLVGILGIGAISLFVGCGRENNTPATTSTTVAEQAASATPGLQPTATVEAADISNSEAELPMFTEAAVWGQNPDGNVRFSAPNGIALDSSDNVYVTEFQGNRVQKFTTDGKLLLEWGTARSENGQFRNPTGIALDLNGNVYVS